MFNKVMKQIMMGGLILPSGIRIGEPLMVPDKMSVSSSSSAANFQAEVLNFYPLHASKKFKTGQISSRSSILSYFRK